VHLVVCRADALDGALLLGSRIEDERAQRTRSLEVAIERVAVLRIDVVAVGLARRTDVCVGRDDEVAVHARLLRRRLGAGTGFGLDFSE
jgi:hypothetical protein